MKKNPTKNKKPFFIGDFVTDFLFRIANKLLDVFTKKIIISFLVLSIAVLIFFGVYWFYDITKQKTRTLTLKVLPAKYKKVKLFPLVSIGSQKWMSNNLDVDHYRNGDPIPHVEDPGE